jgi:Sulfotransferase family
MMPVDTPCIRDVDVPVLYISSWGRSGSTIIDNVLGAYPDVLSVGELHHLWGRGLLWKRACGCGVPVRSCPFWTDVLDAAYGSDRPDPRAMLELQGEVTRTRRTPSLWFSSPPAAAREYAAVIAPLYRAIAEVSDARLVVDSSKFPAEAALLPEVAGVRPYLLHLVRDPRAVAYSWSRRTPHPDRPARLMRQHSAAVSSLRWLTWNALTELTAAGYGGRRMLLRYEDFVADPRGQTEALLGLAGLRPHDGPFLDERTVRLAPNHTVSGNPSRFRSGEVRIAPDDEWRERLPGPSWLIATALSLPLLTRYGYPMRQRARD